MSDPKRATLITVGATKGEKTKVNKTVRLTINLDESNESKYPQLNYKQLVIAEECKKREIVENGKTDGLNPFSDNDDDVERVARKFEQKYGGKSTYGRKGRSKHDDFADIGAGYDENDSFIDNTDGYDEMIPPECDTLYGGFYINCGSLEFKNVERANDEDDISAGRRNKRRISSSSSEESSDSSSDSESAEDKHKQLNGDVDSVRTEHRKKKNKKLDKKKAKKKRRTDSSAATSGKQTSDDNNHGDGESDSRTSQSDSLTSKPNPSSENAITSDSSRDVDSKEVKLPPAVSGVLEQLEAAVSLLLMETPSPDKHIDTSLQPLVHRLERVLSCVGAEAGVRRAVWARAARALHVPRAHLLQRVRAYADLNTNNTASTTPPVPNSASTGQNVPDNSTHNSTANNTVIVNNNKRTQHEMEDIDVTRLSDEEREAKIVQTLQRLKALIDERKPGMMANYNAECERVQEERKKIQIASAAEGAPHIEKRLPKRRFPWCPRSRALLARLVTLAQDQESAALLLAKRALPLFPSGFVRMPTLLRQADLSKEIKINEVKRQRLGSASLPIPTHTPPIQFSEPIQFPSSLTVTTMKPSPEKNEITHNTEDKNKPTSIFGSIINTFSLSKDLLIEKQDVNSSEKNEDPYIPPNNIGSITITPVLSKKDEKKTNNVSVTITEKQKEGLIRVKSPAALNDMVNKQEKVKALENIHKREKDKLKAKEKHVNHSKDKMDTPLHIDTSFQPRVKDPTPTPSPKTKDEITQKQIESMRIAENNIPRPGLVPVSHSPTFAKPDKRPPETKKKKDLLIISDVDPLSDPQEPVSVDDSSSDVELVEERVSESVIVPSDSAKDNVVSEKKSDKLDDATKQEFDSVMKNLRDLEQHSQESPKFNSSYGGVITSAKRDKSSSQCQRFPTTASDKDKLTNFFEQNGWM